jgi:hypothetical protein
LVRRVLGQRIEALRQNVREALVARDGVLEAALVPEIPASAASLSDFSVARSQPSATPRPQTYETPVPERSGYAPILAAFGGIAAAASSIFWVLNRPAAAIVPNAPDSSEIRSSETRRVPARSAGASRAPSQQGVDIGSLPLAAQSAGSADPAPRLRAPLARAPTPPIRVASRPAPSAPEPIEEGPATPTTPVAEEIELEEQLPAPAPSAAAPPSAPSATQPRAAAGPFNRGAALAQLGAASRRAASCKQPAGPTGGGQVTVTFSPDGSPSKVSVASPFAGTSSGACLIGAFSAARVPPFTGSPVTLPWRFQVPE